MNQFLKAMLPLAVLSAITVIGVGCKKDAIKQSNRVSMQLTNGQVVMMSTFDDMLEFPDMQSFLATIDDLNNEVEILEDDFINSYPDMTDDELDSMETVIGFDYQQPYIDFESQFPGYLSLRKDIRDKEDLWLDMGGDLSEDPDNHFVMELGERTLLNHKAQVKINDTLYT